MYLPAFQQLKQRKRGTFFGTVLLCASTGGLSFYVGALWGMQAGVHQANHESWTGTGRDGDLDHVQEVKRLKGQLATTNQEKVTKAISDDTSLSETRFTNAMSSFAGGMASVDRDEFAQQFDVGVPLDPSSSTNQQVLLLYNQDAAMPNATSVRQSTKSLHSPIPSLSVDEGTENCEQLHLILTDFGIKRRQCIAIMGQYESFHIHKFMRLDENLSTDDRIDRSAPLKFVSRLSRRSGWQPPTLPTKEQSNAFWNVLSVYLQSLDSALAKLAPIAKQVVDDQNTIVVMVCNQGQSELLMNFVCSAKGRGLDISHVLVFATDVETKTLAEGLGLKAFYDETIFRSMPKNAAGEYGDDDFTSMMMAKVFCVQMTTMLGYDLLFQDVDVVWYRDPLEYFHNTSSPDHEHDMYFQDDGNRGLYYAPYSANTGFYYVRHNERTLHFFNSLTLRGDVILSSGSHQVALISLLSEHASLYGLKVKVMSREGSDFPGGYHYHERRDIMKDIMTEKVNPYVFHMSWTANKENKVKYLQQSGNWYVQSRCVNETVSTMTLGSDESPRDGSCCTAEPLIKCHFRDKPSKTPCNNSPMLDEESGSFW